MKEVKALTVMVLLVCAGCGMVRSDQDSMAPGSIARSPTSQSLVEANTVGPTADCQISGSLGWFAKTRVRSGQTQLIVGGHVDVPGGGHSLALSKGPYTNHIQHIELVVRAPENSGTPEAPRLYVEKEFPSSAATREIYIHCGKRTVAIIKDLPRTTVN
jgi:hypothetical protein